MSLRTLAIALVSVVVAVLATAPIATATTLTYSVKPLEPPETVFTGSIAADSEGHVELGNPIATISCASHLEGEVESHGEGAAAKGKVGVLTFTGCTNSWHVTTVSSGSLEVIESESGDAAVRSDGATIEATRLGVTCRYATKTTSIGTLTDSFTTGSNATIHLEGAVPFHGGSFLCGGGAVNWTGSYKVTAPDLLAVQKKGGVPKLGFESPNDGKFAVNQEVEISIWDQNSPVAWTLEKVELAIVKGGWSLPDPSPCAAKSVEKEKGVKKICGVKVKCLEKGNARLDTFLSWKDEKGKTEREIAPAPVVCA